MTRQRIAIGMMSGTSCDGVDAVAVSVRGRAERMRAEVLRRVSAAYPVKLKTRLIQAMSPQGVPTGELAELHGQVGEFYARLARSLLSRSLLSRSLQARSLQGRLTATTVTVIGCHGQTVWHRGRSGARKKTPSRTLQIGEMSYVALGVGVPVVCDFRQADIAAGGEGAPLVPWTDYVLFSNRKRSLAVQNIGGIGNVTYLPAGGRPQDVIAFDTGPGNMILDGLVRHISRGRSGYDRDGRRAGRGRVLSTVLRSWMKGPFPRKRPPKTAGWSEFGPSFLTRALKPLRAASKRSDDWLATATAFTAESIADAYRRFLPSVHGRPDLDEVLVAGGGANNKTLMSMLAETLPGIAVRRMDEVGIESQAKEPLSFALLALARLDRVPANLPHVTGAKQPVYLGKLIEP